MATFPVRTSSWIPKGRKQLDDGLDLGLLPRHLERIGVGRDVHDLGAKDVADPQDFRARPRLGIDLDEQHLALDVVLLAEVRHLDHVDELVELLDDLLHDEGIALDHERHPRDGGSSVSPTDRLSILYPRAENSPATRDSTPNLFSTITAIVCFSGPPIRHRTYPFPLLSGTSRGHPLAAFERGLRPRLRRGEGLGGGRRGPLPL
jgi:hypothetical protein